MMSRKMNVMKHTALGAALVVATFALTPLASTPAQAQDAASMSCSQLWYARNKIYADNGYCFNTARARNVFGAGCFPPYGRLSGWARERVNEIQYWESQRGCPR